jgi:hypothetical protein
MYATLPPSAVDRPVGPATGTIPLWSSSFTYSGTTYPYTMVGTDPSLGSSVTVTTRIIPLKFVFSDGTVLDPTTNVCGDTQSAVQRVVNSPLFQSTDFSSGPTYLGNTQYEDAFQRANFWGTVSTVAPGYHVLISSNPALLATQTINVPAPFGHTVAGPCAPIGEISLVFFEAWMHGYVGGLDSTTLPIFLTYNSFFTQGGCCILGYHTAYTGRSPNSSPQTVSVAAYSDPGIFSVPIEDIHAMSHEIGEWMNDPLVNNIVPGWTGGQVSTCSDLLEVGDPVTGIAFTVTLNGFTYHPEDLVFLPWFSRGTPTSANGWYTFLNSYAAPSPVC